MVFRYGASRAKAGDEKRQENIRFSQCLKT